MSAQDMRDMLGLTGDAARPPPLKKQKTVEKRQRPSHLSILPMRRLLTTCSRERNRS
jgi:hypothetical protein